MGGRVRVWAAPQGYAPVVSLLIFTECQRYPQYRVDMPEGFGYTRNI